jgi:hypothetical protein
VTGNLDLLADLLDDEHAPGREAAGPALTRLREAIDQAPKSARWRLRARIGERVRWYEEPEEMGHD